MDRMLHITESELSKIVSDAVNKARDLSNSKFRNMVMDIGRFMERRNVNTLHEVYEDYGCGVSYDNGCGSSKRSYGGGCGESSSDYGCCSSSSRNGC